MVHESERAENTEEVQKYRKYDSLKSVKRISHDLITLDEKRSKLNTDSFNIFKGEKKKTAYYSSADRTFQNEKTFKFSMKKSPIDDLSPSSIPDKKYKGSKIKTTSFYESINDFVLNSYHVLNQKLLESSSGDNNKKDDGQNLDEELFHDILFPNEFDSKGDNADYIKSNREMDVEMYMKQFEIDKKHNSLDITENNSEKVNILKKITPCTPSPSPPPPPNSSPKQPSPPIILSSGKSQLVADDDKLMLNADSTTGSDMDISEVSSHSNDSEEDQLYLQSLAKPVKVPIIDPVVCNTISTVPPPPSSVLSSTRTSYHHHSYPPQFQLSQSHSFQNNVQHYSNPISAFSYSNPLLVNSQIPRGFTLPPHPMYAPAMQGPSSFRQQFVPHHVNTSTIHCTSIPRTAMLNDTHSRINSNAYFNSNSQNSSCHPSFISTNSTYHPGSTQPFINVTNLPLINPQSTFGLNPKLSGTLLYQNDASYPIKPTAKVTSHYTSQFFRQTHHNTNSSHSVAPASNTPSHYSNISTNNDINTSFQSKIKIDKTDNSSNILPSNRCKQSITVENSVLSNSPVKSVFDRLPQVTKDYLNKVYANNEHMKEMVSNCIFNDYHKNWTGISKIWGDRSVSSFEILCQVGEGTYGKVFRSKDLYRDEIVALKKIRNDFDHEGFPITAVREIKILRQLCHKNIVKLRDVISDKDNVSDFLSSPGSFYLVFEYMEHDLMGVLESSGVTFSIVQIQSLFKQLMEALNYCHNRNFLHRDLKCSNILLNNNGVLKLADFGLARLYESEGRPYTNKVITLWYRPPELLFGQERYGPYVDIWSAGCILGELFTKRPILPGNKEIVQLDRIFKLCGSPTLKTWPDVIYLPLYQAMKPSAIYPRKLREHFQFLPSQAVDLLDSMLQLDPHKRISSNDILHSEFLKDIDPSKVDPPKFPETEHFHELLYKKRLKTKMYHHNKSIKQNKNLNTSQENSNLIGTANKPNSSDLTTKELVQSNSSIPNSFSKTDDLKH